MNTTTGTTNATTTRTTTSTITTVNPLSKYRREILYCIEQYSIVILVGTGCTTSTLSSSSSSLATFIPLYILDRFYNSNNNKNNTYFGDLSSTTSTTTTTSSSILPSILITQSDSQIANEITQNAKQELSNIIDRNNNNHNHNNTDFDNIRIGCTTTFQNTNQNHHQNKNTNNTASLSSSLSSEYDIHYMTHDIIIHEILNYDPLLMKYSIIIMNHIQERTINIDVLLGLLYTIRKQRYIHIIILCNNNNIYQANLVLQYFIGKKHAQHIIQTTVNTSTGASSSTSSATTANITDTTELTNQSTGSTASTSTKATTTTTIKEWNRTGRILSIHEQSLQFPNLTTTGTDVVDIYYLSEPTHDYIVTLVETIWSIHQQSIESTSITTTTIGDILCFVPTYNDIHIAIQLSEEYFHQQITNLISSSSSSSSSSKSSSYIHKKYNTVDFIQFSNTIPFHLQQQILQNNTRNTSRRRRIIYTNINVETTTSLLSISIPNIQYVIDTGLIQLQYFDTMIGLYRPYITPISQQHAMLRTSYAGQYNKNNNAVVSSSSSPSSLLVGQCYRLYTESYINDVMKSTSIPEIVRSDMTQYILLLKAIGIENILSFDFITIPSISNIRYGLETLYTLNAIDDTTKITSLGYQIVQFPYYIEPCMARMLLQSITNKCIDDMIIIASIMITVSGTLQQHNDNKHLLQTKPKQHQVQQYMDYDTIMSNFGDMTGDHMSYINIFHDLDQQYIDLREYCKDHFLQYNTIRQCMSIRKHLTQFMKRFTATIASSNQHIIAKSDSYQNFDRSTLIRYCVTTGYIMNIAKLDVDGLYYTIRNHILVIPSSYSFYTNYTKMTSEYIVFCQAAYDDESNSNNSNNNTDGIKVQHVSSIEAKWLREIAPHYFE